jgi:hypothetical protein
MHVGFYECPRVPLFRGTASLGLGMSVSHISMVSDAFSGAARVGTADLPVQLLIRTYLSIPMITPGSVNSLAVHILRRHLSCRTLTAPGAHPHAVTHWVPARTLGSASERG